MSRLTVKDSGIVYKNPIPHVYSRHGAHPSAACLGGGKMVAVAQIGQAFEAADTRANLFFSEDDGRTWSGPVPFNPGLPADKSDLIRIATTGGGVLTAVYFIHDRSIPEMGYTHPETQGFVDGEMFTVQSFDGGLTWGPYKPIRHGFTQPLECQSAVVVHPDGRWLLPTSTFRCWDGTIPDGMYTFALASPDEGDTWPDMIPLFDRRDEGRVYYESCVAVRPDGLTLAVAWDYDEIAHQDHTVKYVTSPDGRAFSGIRSTGLQGQTTSCIFLPDGRVVTVYRRTDRPGLYAALANLDEEGWAQEDEVCLWSNGNVQLMSHSDSMSENFAKLKFGAPRTILRNGNVYLVFWCYEDYQGIIRWMEIGLA